MDKEIKKQLSKVNRLEPSLTIGKNGLTENVIKGLKQHLKNRKLIKVKILRSFIKEQDKKQLFNEIAEKTGSKIVNTVGFTVTLFQQQEVVEPAKKSSKRFLIQKKEENNG